MVVKCMGFLPPPKKCPKLLQVLGQFIRKIAQNTARSYVKKVEVGWLMFFVWKICVNKNNRSSQIPGCSCPRY